MKNELKSKLLSALLASSILLSGCGKKSDCDLPVRHIHKYTKQVTEDISIERFIDSEKLEVDGYHWTKDHIDINKTDELFAGIITKNKLVNGLDNNDYLYYLMSNNKDYLEFYYYYIKEELRIAFDSDGDPHLKLDREIKQGWTDDPNFEHNTGLVRLNHYVYSGFKIIKNNKGKFVLDRSNKVDDIRDVLEEYPYIILNNPLSLGEGSIHIIYKDFEFEAEDLPSLKVEDFYDEFNHPDLSNNEIILN